MPNPLFDKLAQYGDVESSITIYLEATAAIKEQNEIQRIARNRVATYLAQTGEMTYRCLAGTAKYTTPRTPRLDKKAWDEAVLRDDALAAVQREFNRMQIHLDNTQEPFKTLPDPQLRISRV